MKTLIVTEDLTVIKSLTGGLGSLYVKIIETVLKLNLKLSTQVYRGKKVLVVSNLLINESPSRKLISWDTLLNKNKLDLERVSVWNDINKHLAPLFKDLRCQEIPFLETWKTYLAIYLSHQVFAYRQALARLLDAEKIEQLIVVGSSYQTKIACQLAAKKKIKIIYWSDLSIAKVNRYILDWLHQRQLKSQAQRFIAVSQTKMVNYPRGGILLAASFFRHLKTLLPLHSSLLKRKINSLIIGDSPAVKKIVNRQGVDNKRYFDLAETMNCSDKKKLYIQQKQKGQKHWQKLKSQYSLEIYSGYLQNMCKEAFPLMSLYLTAAEKIIRLNKPKGLILVSDVRPVEVSLGLIAKKLAIKSLLVSPNTILSLDAINQYKLAKKITVVGPHLKKSLQKMGVATETIQEVGDLRFDWLTPTKFDQLRQKNFLRLGLSNQDKVFLLISFRPNPRIPLSEKEKFFKLCDQAIQTIAGATLIIKPHPTEAIETLKTQMKRWKMGQYLVTNNQEFELTDLLSVSQATLLTWSMSGFESLLVGVPVVVVNPTTKNYDQIIPYVKDNGAQLARTSVGLKEILTKLINDQTTRQQWVRQGKKFVSAYIKLPDGRVADRIIALLS